MIPNHVEFHQDVAILKLTQRKTAIVDIADYPLVAGHRWHVHKAPHQYYAYTNVPTPDGKQTILQMHRLLLPDAAEIDHVDHDGLNNQRGNLRECTRAQNNMNSRKRKDGSSHYKGVCWDKAKRKWWAQIKADHVQIFLGYFTSEIEAAHAYDDDARERFGEFACLNFPERAEAMARQWGTL